MFTKSPVTTNLKIEQLPNPLLSNKYMKDGSSELVDEDFETEQEAQGEYVPQGVIYGK